MSQTNPVDPKKISKCLIDENPLGKLSDIIQQAVDQSMEKENKKEEVNKNV